MPSIDLPVRGAWHITSTEVWARKHLDLLGPAFLRFDADEPTGEFGMIAVRGWLHCYYGERDGKPLVEWSWNGDDDGNPTCGRGWAVLESDGKLRGRIFLHLGDDSGFVAERMEVLSQQTGRAARRRQPR